MTATAAGGTHPTGIALQIRVRIDDWTAEERSLPISLIAV